MIRLHTLTDGIALRMLERDGVAVIWLSHLAAAQVYRQGHKAVAEAIIEIADAAEREWMRGNALALIGDWL
jgi:hypothetical protein